MRYADPADTLTLDQLAEQVAPDILALLEHRGIHPVGPRWVLIDDQGRPHTINAARRASPHKWATLIRETRLYWWHLATHARIPRLAAVRVVALPLHRDHRSPQDTAACAPAVKAAVDGLVDAGVMRDDGPNHLRAVVFLPPAVLGLDGLALLIEDIS